MNSKRLATAAVLSAAMIGLHPVAFAGGAAGNWERVVFHVDDVANARWAMMLARSYLEDAPGARIVFVTYGPGIDFLLEDTTDVRGNPFDPAVSLLVEQGVEFRLCAATLTAREIARDDVHDAVVVVPSGISEIARLQLKEGYAYLKP